MAVVRCHALQLGEGAMVNQGPQVVCVRGFEMAGDLVVECHG